MNPIDLNGWEDYVESIEGVEQLERRQCSERERWKCIQQIIQQKQLEMTRLKERRFAKENVRFPHPGYNELEWIQKTNKYYDERDAPDRRKSRASLAVKDEFKERLLRMAYKFIRSMFGPDQYVQIQHAADAQMRNWLIDLIEEHLQQWLLNEFHYTGECPLCIEQLHSEFGTREHIKHVHLSRLAVEVVNKFFNFLIECKKQMTN